MYFIWYRKISNAFEIVLYFEFQVIVMFRSLLHTSQINFFTIYKYETHIFLDFRILSQTFILHGDYDKCI